MWGNPQSRGVVRSYRRVSVLGHVTGSGRHVGGGWVGGELNPLVSLFTPLELYSHPIKQIDRNRSRNPPPRLGSRATTHQLAAYLARASCLRTRLVRFLLRLISKCSYSEIRIESFPKSNLRDIGLLSGDIVPSGSNCLVWRRRYDFIIVVRNFSIFFHIYRPFSSVYM